MDDSERPVPVSGASERIQRILSSAALSRLSRVSQSSSGQASPIPGVAQTRLGGNIPIRSNQEEMAQAFPALYRTRAYPYNPQRNYGASSSRQGHSQGSGSGRPVSSHRSYKQKPSVKNFVKKVVLVDPEEMIVPKGRKRQQACDEGSCWHDGI